MKYKITDKQLDDVIFLYLDNQDFIQIERGDNIHFTNSEGDEYAQSDIINLMVCVIYIGS